MAKKRKETQNAVVSLSVRLPAQLHKHLKDTARRDKVSLNALAIHFLTEAISMAEPPQLRESPRSPGSMNDG
jgi:predicted HicB family RNase H-like nuclease